MLSPPYDLDIDDVVSAIEWEWQVRPRELAYLPVGFGAHHWDAQTDRGRFFVTVHDLRLHGAPGDPVGVLRRTFRATRQLKEQAQLSSIAAALPTVTGEILVPVGSAFVLSLYDWIEIRPLDDPDGSVTARVVAQLHLASAACRQLDAPREDFAMPHRTSLEEALRDLAAPWHTGPYGEPARALLTRHQMEVRRALASYDRLVLRVQQMDRPWCLTHGEPNGWNLVQDAAGAPRLVDWDSARIAPPERDLWQLDHQPQSVATYQRLTGGPSPHPDILRLYRLWWDLAETAVYVLQFHRPHTADANMAESWTNFQTYLPTAQRWPDLSGDGLAELPNPT